MIQIDLNHHTNLANRCLTRQTRFSLVGGKRFDKLEPEQRTQYRKYDPGRLASVAEKVIELFATNQLSLKIAKVFDLGDAAEAHRLIESRKYEGKVLLKI